MPSVDSRPVPIRARDLPRSFWWLWLAMLVTWMGRFVVPFMTLFLTNQLGFGVGTAGAIVAGYGGGVVVSALVGGILVDRVGRKKTLVGSQLLSAGVMVLIPFFPEAVWIASLMFLFGLVNGAAQPAISTLVTDLVPRTHRRQAFAYTYWAVNLGYAIGPMIAGFVAEQAFHYLFFAQAGVLVISAAIVVSRVSDSYVPERAAQVPNQDGQKSPTGLLSVFRDRVFILFVAGLFLYSVVYVQSTAALPLTMASQGLSSQQYGLLLTLNGFILCLFQIPSAKYLERWPRERVMLVFLCVTALGVLLQAFATDWIWYAVAVAIWSIGEMGIHPTGQSIAADMASKRLRGRYLGAYALAFSAATMIGPLFGGFMIQFFGATALWLACTAICLAVALFLTSTAKVRQNRIRSLRPPTA